MAGITLAQAQAQLDLWLAASTTVASGQSYSIAGRSLSRVNASEINTQLIFWDTKVKKLTLASQRRSRTRYGVPASW